MSATERQVACDELVVPAFDHLARMLAPSPFLDEVGEAGAHTTDPVANTHGVTVGRDTSFSPSGPGDASAIFASGADLGDRGGEAAILGRPDPVRQMLWSEIMPSRYVRNHRTRRDRLGNDPPLLLIAPPSAADRARYLRAALNNLRVVTNVDHNVHTILYPERIAIVHHSPPLSYVG
jgi:hypothetical protein